MSNALLTACWPLQMPPTAKAVLVSLADNAHDDGHCWPSLTSIAERTCFGRTAVIDAIKWLEANGAIKADRSDRYRTTYTVTPSCFVAGELVRLPNQSASRTSTPNGELVRLPDDEVRLPDDEVRQADTKHQEPSRTINKATTKKSAVANALARPDGVMEQTWADWLALRKAKRAPVTETVLRQAEAEAGKADLPLERFLQIWCARGSQGLQADWLKPTERGPPAGVTPIRPSASADFRGKTYADTPIDQLPADLRDAARAAIANG